MLISTNDEEFDPGLICLSSIQELNHENYWVFGTAMMIIILVISKDIQQQWEG
jgi:hypothetical protein